MQRHPRSHRPPAPPLFLQHRHHPFLYQRSDYLRHTKPLCLEHLFQFPFPACLQLFRPSRLLHTVSGDFPPPCMAATTNSHGPDERQERFLRLFLPVHDRLARFARAMSRDRDEARDLVGETVLVAYEHFDQLTDPQAFVSWLFTIARRIAMRTRKRSDKYVLFDPHDPLEIPAVADPAPGPEDATDLEFLYAALTQLPNTQREAVTLFEISGLSLEEIRAIQGGSLSGVKSRVARGRQKLAMLLGVNDAPSVAVHSNGVARAPLRMAQERRTNG